MKNLFAVGALAALVLPFASSAQAVREAIITAETTFAAQAAREGIKVAFLANSSPTGLVAEDGKLLNAQALWTARPAQPDSRLSWHPVWADVAQSGDLGYTTGPWTAFVKERPQASGEYVTVWRKQPDGTLKFAVNVGVERVGVAAPKVTVVPQPRLMAAVATPSAAPTNVLIDLDNRFSKAELLKPGATYQQFLSSEARLYRTGLSMMKGEAAVANMKNLEGRYIFATTGGYLAAAGDLGYVVGTVRREAGAKYPEENGTYLRIWRREEVAGWRIVLEIFNFEPGQVVTPVAGTGPVGPAQTKRPQ